MLCMNANEEKHIPINLPTFYKQVIYCWHLSGGGNKAPKNVGDIRTQILWGNKYIQNKGKTLLFTHWKESNINFVDDLLNEDGRNTSSTTKKQEKIGYLNIRFFKMLYQKCGKKNLQMTV